MTMAKQLQEEENMLSKVNKRTIHNKEPDNEPGPESPKLEKAQIIAIRTLMDQLDNETKKSFVGWIQKISTPNLLRKFFHKNGFDRCMASLTA